MKVRSQIFVFFCGSLSRAIAFNYIDRMSFWQKSPGPFWYHWIQSLISSQTISILDTKLHEKKKVLKLPEGFQSTILDSRHSNQIVALLRNHYVVFPKARCVLSNEECIRGFMNEGWLGIGVFNSKKELIACVVSRPIGDLEFSGSETLLKNCGIVDFLCVSSEFRMMKLSSYMLQELVELTSKEGRMVHIFQKEGLPLSPLPPLWSSQYLWRKRNKVDPVTFLKRCDSSILEELTIDSTSIRNRTKKLGSSSLWKYSCLEGSIVLCLLDLHHRSVPEGYRMGEILWQLDLTEGNTNELRQKATEAIIDQCDFDIVMIDATLPHDLKKGWQTDSSYSWYIFNCDPGNYFSTRPYWIL